MADKKRNHYEEKFKKAKRELREGAFILYFESLFRDDDIDDIFDAASEVNDPDDNINISEESCELAKKIADGNEDALKNLQHVLAEGEIK